MERTSKIMPYEVPDNYFTHLPEELTTSAMVANGRMDVSVMGGANIATPYDVSDSYFTDFSAAVMDNILQQNESAQNLRKKVGTEHPYSAPEGYFDSLIDTVMHRIQHDDEDLVDTSFIAAYKTNVYEVPKDYFNTFEVTIPDSETTKSKALYPNERKFRLNSWAMAASMLLFITIGGLLVNKTINRVDGADYALQQLAHVPKDEIQQYIQDNLDEFDLSILEKGYSNNYELPSTTTKSILENVSKQDIQEYIENEGI